MIFASARLRDNKRILKSENFMMFRFQFLRLVTKILSMGLGIFFIVIGLMKLFQLDLLRADIVRFQLFPDGWEWAIAPLGVACELVVGICLLFRKMYTAAAIIGSLMCFLFVTIFVQGWIRGLPLSCACLGVERVVDNYPLEIFWRLLLLGAMLVLVWDSMRQSRLFDKVVRLDFRDI